MPGNTRGIQRGDSSLPHPPGILGLVADGSACRGILRDGVTGFLWDETVRPFVPHHIQFGGESIGVALGSGDGR